MTSIYLSAIFWQATAERTVRTAAQAALALIGTGALGILDVDWQGVASASALAAIACVLTCIAAAKTGGRAGPSLGSSETTEQAQDPALPDDEFDESPVSD